MSGNDSMVVIKTENEIAKRTILNVVGEVSGAFIKVPKEELVLEMEIESQIMMLILKALLDIVFLWYRLILVISRKNLKLM